MKTSNVSLENLMDQVSEDEMNRMVSTLTLSAAGGEGRCGEGEDEDRGHDRDEDRHECEEGHEEHEDNGRHLGQCR